MPTDLQQEKTKLIQVNLQQIVSTSKSLGGGGKNAHPGRVRHLLNPPRASSTDKPRCRERQLQSKSRESLRREVSCSEEGWHSIWQSHEVPGVGSSQLTALCPVFANPLYKVPNFCSALRCLLQITVVTSQLQLGFPEVQEENQRSLTQ